MQKPWFAMVKDISKLSFSTKMNSIIEAVNSMRNSILEDHERASEVSLALQETAVFEALN